MWDKPRELNNLSSVLFGISLLLLLYGALHYVLRLPEFKLRVVQLNVVPRQIDVAQIEAVVRDELHGNFFTVDLDNTQRAFERLPWVRKVNVRRHFPWKLEVEIEEHIALAHWSRTELVNTHGEVFTAGSDKVLPDFSGQADSAVEVTQMYHAFTEQLAPLKQEIAQINLSPRRAWQLRLNNGLMLKLGREQAQQRLARFVAVFPWTGINNQDSVGSGAVQYVDLRYRNGFAVMYRQPV